MGLPKGRTNNINGRPKGSANKLTTHLRESITEFLSGEFKSVAITIKKLPPRERVKAYCDLLQYGLPKLQATSLDIDFEKLSDEQLDEIINRLMEASQKNQHD